MYQKNNFLNTPITEYMTPMQKALNKNIYSDELIHSRQKGSKNGETKNPNYKPIGQKAKGILDAATGRYIYAKDKVGKYVNNFKNAGGIRSRLRALRDGYILGKIGYKNLDKAGTVMDNVGYSIGKGLKKAKNTISDTITNIKNRKNYKKAKYNSMMNFREANANAQKQMFGSAYTKDQVVDWAKKYFGGNKIK